MSAEIGEDCQSAGRDGVRRRSLLKKKASFARTGGLTATVTEGWAEVMYGLATGVDVDEVIEEQVKAVVMAFERFISKACCLFRSRV